MTIFEGSAVALVLPMFDNGDIDFEGFKKQVQRMIDGGVQALLVNGTTGETATITIEDEFKLFKDNIGSRIINLSFLSTSLDPNIIHSFDGNMYLVIEVEQN